MHFVTLEVLQVLQRYDCPGTGFRLGWKHGDYVLGPVTTFKSFKNFFGLLPLKNVVGGFDLYIILTVAMGMVPGHVVVLWTLKEHYHGKLTTAVWNSLDFFLCRNLAMQFTAWTGTTKRRFSERLRGTFSIPKLKLYPIYRVRLLNGGLTSNSLKFSHNTDSFYGHSVQ